MSELVNHPEHYQAHGLEVIEVIEAFNLNFSLGNAIKYILRAEKKANKKQDLEKALWYLKHELQKFEG
jgi:translation initiation factor 2B subunit (eIF-2B alpha/beta/delta family)